LYSKDESDKANIYNNRGEEDWGYGAGKERDSHPFSASPPH